MAVYTKVSDAALKAFLALYDLGVLKTCKGIAEGVENSNFFLQTGGGRYILTLYEKRVEEADLPYFLSLMEHLAAKGFSCPVAIADRAGGKLNRLCSRPAAIISFLEGLPSENPTPAHCRKAGYALADLHIKGRDFSLHRKNNLGAQGWRTLFEGSRSRCDEVKPGLGAETAGMLAFLESAWPAALPEGVIHADFFPDNVFFLQDRFCGLIDFYFACHDMLAYDLAIALNAWCFEADGRFYPDKASAFIRGYDSLRALQEEELAALPVLAYGAAMRFFLSRLYDWLNVPQGALVIPKDPMEYYRKLLFHRQKAVLSDYGIAL